LSDVVGDGGGVGAEDVEDVDDVGEVGAVGTVTTTDGAAAADADNDADELDEGPPTALLEGFPPPTMNVTEAAITRTTAARTMGSRSRLLLRVLMGCRLSIAVSPSPGESGPRPRR
jgi:hypothetical protein